MTYAIAVIGIGLVLVYVGWLVMLWRFQERIVFQPPAGATTSQIPARQIRYRASDGVDLFAYVVGECAVANTVVIAFHGNADISRWFVPWAHTVAHESGACVVLPEYRGYDGLAGAPSYESSRRDALAAFVLVHDTLGVPLEKIVYFGHSLGTAIAAELAAVHAPRVLVLQSPFSTARDMARRMVLPGITALWGIMSRVHFDNIARVRELACPVWVAHGDNDMIIPMRMGREVFAAASSKGELLIAHEAGHNDVPEVAGREYWAWIKRAVGAASPVQATPGAPRETRSAL